MARGSGTSNFWIDASDSPSFSRSREATPPSAVSTCSLPGRFHLLARHHVAGLRVDRFEREDVVASERCDRAGEQRLQLLALRDFARDRARDRLVGRALHQPQGVAHAFVRKHLQERRLLERDRQRHLQRAVEHRLAGGVREVGQHDGVVRGQRLIAAPRQEERNGDDAERHDGGNARCQLPPSRLARALLGSCARSRARHRRQAVGDRLRRCRPGVRIRRERLQDDALELRVDVRQERRRPYRIHPRTGSRERVLSDEQFVQEQPQRVDVGPLRQRRARQQLFGRHVVGRPDQRVRHAVEARDRDAEIGDAHLTVFVDQDVGGLQVAMQHAAGVRGGEPGAQLPRDVDDLLGGQPPDAPEQRGQVFAADQLHREEDFAVGFADIEDAADRRVRDLPRQPDFVQDAAPRPGRRRPNELQRDRRLEHQIVGAPDLAHAAAADARDHPVAAGEHLAGGKSGRVGVRADRPPRARALFMKGQERLHLLAEARVGSAGLGDEFPAFGRGNVQGAEE